MCYMPTLHRVDAVSATLQNDLRRHLMHGRSLVFVPSPHNTHKAALPHTDNATERRNSASPLPCLRVLHTLHVRLSPTNTKQHKSEAWVY